MQSWYLGDLGMSLKGPIDGHFLFLDSFSALLLGIGVLAPPLGVLLRYLGALGWWTSRDGVAAGMFFPTLVQARSVLLGPGQDV